MSRTSLKHFDIYVGLFVATILISNILAQKVFIFFGFPFTAGIIVFPFAYILGDVLTEVYGYARARRVIWIGFVALMLFIILTEVAIVLPPAAFWLNQQSFEQTLHSVPRIALASLAAYLVGEFVNSFTIAKLKIRDEGARLWKRVVLSTVLGQAVDTGIFVLLAFVGVFQLGALIQLIMSAYVFKVVYEIVAAPLTCALIVRLKKSEGLDVFDHHTDFNPLSLQD